MKNELQRNIYEYNRNKSSTLNGLHRRAVLQDQHKDSLAIFLEQNLVVRVICFGGIYLFFMLGII